MNDRTPTPLRDGEQLDAALEEPLVVLYKHSPYCGLSALAAREVRAFSRMRPDIPVYQVDVIMDRPVSREVARRLSVRHESPQVLVLRDGEVVWHGSHRSVRASELAEQIA